MYRILVTAAACAWLAGCGEPVPDTNSTNADTVRPVDPAADNIIDTVTTQSGGAMAASPAEINRDGNIGPGVNVVLPGTAQDYVAQAASAGQYEIQASQYLLDQSKNAFVRAFAQQMVDDHRAVSAKLATVARNNQLTAPGTELSVKHQTQLNELRAAPTNILDQIYIAQQRGAHVEAIALHQAASGVDMPEAVKAHARETLVAVQGHARMLRDLNPAA